MKHMKPMARTGLAVAGAAAAVGVAAGIAARMGARGLRVAAEPLAGDWLDTVKGQHLEILDLVERAEGTKSTATARRTALLGKIKVALTRHAIEEENVLYPLLRLEELAEQAHSLVDDHADVKAILYDLDQIPPDDSRWIERMKTLRRELETHMQLEETDIFPALRLRLTPEEDSRLTVALRREGRLLS
ncbi:MAG TPA: hemerythrin domain-containing protein [Caulobacteraceae bacterium]|nr:hemerythrin domain-containing protein [Caulobacteraceae bacterium]